MTKSVIITRAVWVLSLVSLCTDMASEMLYPVMPLFLKSIGFSIVLIGLLEGLAEAVASLSKGYFGKLSDHLGRRILFVRFGYALSAISKPMMAAFVFPSWIFFSRTLDRLGKGIRTGSRDAMLSNEATSETKGRVFGFHRAWDTAGAFVGPCFGLLFLYFYPSEYRSLFFIALAPGVLAVLLTFALAEPTSPSPSKSSRVSFFAFLNYWRTSSAEYRKLVIGLVLFALVNSSDVFLLLWAKESGLTDVQVVAVYIFYNFIYAITSYPAGAMADKLGLKKTLVVGTVLFALVYGGMAMTSGIVWVTILFMIYGVYAASTESVAKAWISSICRREDVGTAIGTYAAFQGISSLIASLCAGLIWYYWSPTALFSATALAAFGISIYLSRLKNGIL